MLFDQFGLHSSLLQGVTDLGFTEPTPIQAEAIPPALAGRDVLASAKTGSGKTAAFLLPILSRLLDRPRGTTRTLIVTPTRELATQIDEQFAGLAYHTAISSAAIYGGVEMNPQSRALERGVDVVVATPGRLLDHLRQPFVRLDQVEVLVLDEADRMLDMGFLPDIRRILRHLPGRLQTLFFSATMPPPIVELTRELLRDPVRINIGTKSVPAEGVTHTIFPVAAEQKGTLLLELLEPPDIDRALVFTRTKERAGRLASYLERNEVPVAVIHGDRSQAERNEALQRFKQGRIRVLVATDVAARGIDIEDLSHVVNFDVPGQPDDYIHRVGRTARAGATGDAYTFVSPAEESALRAIEKSLGRPLPRLRTRGGASSPAEGAAPAGGAAVPSGREHRRGPRQPRRRRRKLATARG